MKSTLLLLLALSLSTTHIFSQDIFIKTGNRGDENTKVKLVSSDNSMTAVSVELNGFYNKKVDVSSVVYDEIYLKEFASLGNEGQSALPTITKFISIPNYRNVRIEIKNSQSQVFDSYNVIPYQRLPLRNTNASVIDFQKDEDFYLMNKNFPEEIVSIKEIAVMRDHRIAVVTINPIQYNPVIKQLIVYTSIDFELKYEGYSNVNNVLRTGYGVSRSFENIYKQTIFNYTDNTFTVPPNMQIIVADSLYNSILPYSAWKTKKGIKTTVKKLSELGSANPTPEQLKDFLIAQYNTPESAEFVLLVGDARGNNVISWFEAIGGKSDHPYQCLDGTDILPEIVVGRISVQSRSELDSALIKFIHYEKQPNMTETEWYKRAFILHSNDGIDPINGEVAESVFLNEGGFTNVDIANPSTSQASITSSLNEGISWVWFIGHGSETAWASPYWDMSNMINLNFGKRQPNIVSIACSNADLDYAQTADCFGEAWVERSPQNSATNIAASTELCAFYTTDTIGREMLYAYFRHGIYDFGSMLNFGKIQAYNYFNGNGTVVATINQFMVLGDPSIESYSDIPKPLNVVSSSAGNNFTINVKVVTQNIKGALVAINQNNQLKISGYTDSLGNATFNNSYIQGGIVNVVVTGKNLYPYDADMILTSVNNFSQTPDGYLLNQNYPNPFNPKTIINYNIPSNVKRQTSNVKLVIYNSLGREISTLVNEIQIAGSYSVQWDAGNYSSGIYFYKLSAGEFVDVKKMTLVK